MSILGATFVAIGFAILAHWVGLVSKSREVFEVSRTAAKILGDRSMGGEDKEKLLQNHSLRLFALLGTLLAGSAMSLLVPFGILWLIDLAGYPLLDQTVSMLQRGEFLVGATVAGFAVFYVLRRFAS